MLPLPPRKASAPTSAMSGRNSKAVSMASYIVAAKDARVGMFMMITAANMTTMKTKTGLLVILPDTPATLIHPSVTGIKS